MASSRGRAGENFGVWQGAWLDIRPWPDKISSIVFAHFSTPDMSMGGMGGTLVLRSHSKFQVIQALITTDLVQFVSLRIRDVPAGFTSRGGGNPSWSGSKIQGVKNLAPSPLP